MKKILITGKDSYIGTSFEKWVSQWPDKYQVTTIDVRDDSWKSHDFSQYDTVFHVAGIAHVSTNPKLKDLYFKVNRDLSFEVAKISKLYKVKQFIYMSSIIVYGNLSKTNGMINENTHPNPENFYGESKLQAEKLLRSIETKEFQVTILRPPMIYGLHSKGNYPKLSKLSRYMIFFPKFENNRSMLHIDNLCQFVKCMIDNSKSGTFFPQNSEFVTTYKLVETIRSINKKKTLLIKLFNPFIRLLLNTKFMNKIFGTLTYEKNMSKYEFFNYQIRTFKESILLTEIEGKS